jgi:hypothetical protein
VPRHFGGPCRAVDGPLLADQSVHFAVRTPAPHVASAAVVEREPGFDLRVFPADHEFAAGFDQELTVTGFVPEAHDEGVAVVVLRAPALPERIAPFSAAREGAFVSPVEQLEVVALQVVLGDELLDLVSGSQLLVPGGDADRADRRQDDDPEKDAEFARIHFFLLKNRTLTGRP